MKLGTRFQGSILLNLPNPLNSENGRIPTADLLNEICRQSHLPCWNSNFTVGLAKLTASSITNLNIDLSKVSETLCFWQWKVLKTFRTYRFQKTGLNNYQKRLHIPKQEGCEKRNWFERIHPKFVRLRSGIRV